jgi:small subunit ribosomal protein S10|tara:strand:- start:3460 stop:3783 length:324 start_codon:yes stop_codon:yes gene_type:complete
MTEKNIKAIIKIKGFNNFILEKIAHFVLKEAQNLKITPAILHLPTKNKKFTLLKSPHVHKKAREQFELVTFQKKIVVKGSILELKRLIHFLENDINLDTTFQISFVK